MYIPVLIPCHSWEMAETVPSAYNCGFVIFIQDIRFINLPAVIVLNEDNDDEIQSMIDILTYDHNFHLHDNVTCYMNFTPYEDNLFVLEHDGRNDYDCKYYTVKPE